MVLRTSKMREAQGITERCAYLLDGLCRALTALDTMRHLKIRSSIYHQQVAIA